MVCVCVRVHVYVCVRACVHACIQRMNSPVTCAGNRNGLLVPNTTTDQVYMDAWNRGPVWSSVISVCHKLVNILVSLVCLYSL